MHNWLPRAKACLVLRGNAACQAQQLTFTSRWVRISRIKRMASYCWLPSAADVTYILNTQQVAVHRLRASGQHRPAKLNTYHLPGQLESIADALKLYDCVTDLGRRRQNWPSDIDGWCSALLLQYWPSSVWSSSRSHDTWLYGLWRPRNAIASSFQVSSATSDMEAALLPADSANATPRTEVSSCSGHTCSVARVTWQAFSPGGGDLNKDAYIYLQHALGIMLG